MRKLLLSISIILFISMFSSAQTVQIAEAGGWFETAYAKWIVTAEVDTFQVYYSGEGVVDRRIDEQLIRKYPTYYRADIPGLKAGNYTLKIVPVVNKVEGTPTITNTVTVMPHHRSGFAFSNGRVPGAYKADGTPKDNAVILYITENTKNTVSMDVTGANANPCVGLQMILDGFKKGRDNRPLIIRMIGQITDLEFMQKGDIVIENNNNVNSYITLEGIGDDAVADGWGIRVKNAVNIEIRNIGTMNCDSDEGDNIGLQQNNEYIWVHHCDFFYGAPGSASDQAKGDGALDSKLSGYVTFSYNHFWDTGKSNLLGNGVEPPGYLTYHHNWYDHSDSRHPRVRSHNVHVYNNYFDGISKYGVGATNASSVFVEANYFRNCRYPMLISMQGSDVWDASKNANDYNNMPTFSKEDGGMIKAFNNYMVGQHRFVPYGAAGFVNSSVDFDAYVASSRDEMLGTGIQTYKGANSYNNFDTNPAVMYAYTPDSPEAARERVILYAGRMHGGDFKWTFNNAVDDTSSDVNPALRNALNNYKTSLIAIQGDGIAQGGTDPDDEEPGDQPTGDIVHNFTVAGKTSNFFTITGNLSDSKGTVQYAGLTLTQCLKIESATVISFTITQEYILTLVLNSEFNGKIKVNGVDRVATGGIVTLTLAPGTHEIRKADTANLFYISLQRATTAIAATEAVRISVYPNPATEMIYISGADTVEKVEIIHLSGALVYRVHGNVSAIDLGSVSPGSYIVRIYGAGGVTTQRLIKQ